MYYKIIAYKMPFMENVFIFFKSHATIGGLNFADTLRFS